MLGEVKKCVDAKTGFFEEYFTVPETLREDVEHFISDTEALGEACGSAGEFEARFVSEGLSARFNALLPKCTPIAKKMTKEDKAKSRKIAKEILMENKEEWARDILMDTAGTVLNEVRDERLSEERERMIEEGTFADYTIRQNRLRTAGAIAGFFRDKFKSKGGNQK